MSEHHHDHQHHHHDDDCSSCEEEEECGCCACHGHRNDIPYDRLKPTLKYLQKGTGEFVGNDGSQVTINYTMKFKGEIVDEKTNYQFTIGDSMDKIICEGIELMSEYMHVGDICTMDLHPKIAFGDIGSPERNIPPNALIQMKIELVDLVKFPTAFEMESEQLFPFAQQKKEEGNTYFKNKQFNRAIRSYYCALEYLEEDYRIPNIVIQDVVELRHILHNNLSAVFIHEKEWSKVVAHTSIILKEDDCNWKAFMRRGTAFLNQNKLEKARKDLETALDFEPENRDIKQQLAICRQRQAAALRKEKNVYAQMF